MADPVRRRAVPDAPHPGRRVRGRGWQAIVLAPSAGRLGLRAATRAESSFEWRLDAGLAQRFASLSLSLADAHPEAGHHCLDGDADQEIAVRLSLNECPPTFLAGGA